MSGQTFSLVEPFDCDDPTFCLGVEWEMFRQRLLAGQPFKDLIQTGNVDRLVAMCERHGRFVETVVNDQFEEWTQIIVGGTRLPGPREKFPGKP